MRSGICFLLLMLFLVQCTGEEKEHLGTVRKKSEELKKFYLFDRFISGDISREAVYEKGVENNPSWPSTTCTNFYGDTLDCFVRIYDTILETNDSEQPVQMRVWESKADSWQSCYRYWVNYKGDSIHLLSNYEWCGISDFYWISSSAMVFDGLHHYYYRDSNLTAFGEEVGTLYLKDFDNGINENIVLNTCYTNTPFGIFYKDAFLYYFEGENSYFDFIYWIKSKYPEANDDALKEVEKWIAKKME